jgi:hypothetical protein
MIQRESEAAPDRPIVSSIKVPVAAGHTETRSGFTIASFGYVGDDFSRIDVLFDAVTDHLARQSQPRVVELVAEPTKVHAFYRDNFRPKTALIEAPVIWTSRRDGLTWALADAKVRNRLLDGFRALKPHYQWLVLESPPPVEMDSALAEVGVKLYFANAEHGFFAEFEYPEAHIVCAIHGADDDYPRVLTEDWSSRPMVVAPRLIEQLKSLIEQQKVVALFDALLAHPAALTFCCNGAGEPFATVWHQGGAETLVVYPDAMTCLRAIRELTSSQETHTDSSMEMASCAPRSLMEMVRDAGSGLAIGWYPSSSETIRHFVIEPDLVQTLCSGAMPSQYSALDFVRISFGFKPRHSRKR